MAGKLNGRKIYFGDWLDQLKYSIYTNIEISEVLKETKKDKKEYFEERIRICNKLIDKIEKYAKEDEIGEYMYMFPNELEDIMWILLENSFVEKQ